MFQLRHGLLAVDSLSSFRNFHLGLTYLVILCPSVKVPFLCNGIQRTAPCAPKSPLFISPISFSGSKR